MNNKVKNLWFKRRRYGWGWTPVTWQGWVSILLFLLILLADTFSLPAKPAIPNSGEVLLFFIVAFADIIGLLVVSYIKGPMPHWRWGKTSHDRDDEDF
jgi:hypothetical protein